MAGRIATINGTMLVPGVSRNRRLYSRELIARAAARMQERIADPDGLPIVMRSHHDAGDDSVRIVGRLTSVKVGDDGAARYTADLYDTTHGRDIAALVVPEKGQPPALKSVSIHGYWLGPVKTVTHDGESVTTGDDLEIDAVDFTATPGVTGATVDAASWLRPGATGESVAGRTRISESAEATVEAVSEDADEAYSAKQKQQMLAKGQAVANASGAPSYPIKTKADLRRAIRAVGRGGADHDTVRKHIIARATALGLLRMIPDNWNEDGSMKETTPTRFSDVREYYDGPGSAAGFAIDAFNGPTSITIRNCSIDPAELRVIAAAAMTAVVNALQALDPDMDADVDIPGAPRADTDDDMVKPAESGASPDDDMETASRAGQPLTSEQARTFQAASEAGLLEPGQVITPAVLDALTETAPPEQGAATTSDKEEAAMGEPTTETQAAAPAPAPLIALTQEQFAALLDRVGHAPAAAPAAESVPATPVDAQAKAERKAAKEQAKAEKRALAERRAADRQALADEVRQQVRDELRAELLKENGLPPRQGYRVHENDQSGPDTTSDEDLFADRANVLLGNYGLMQPAQ